MGPRRFSLSNGVANLLGYATKGTEFLFGPSESNPLAHTFAIAALPVIIFFASLVAILYYLGIMQRIVRWVGGAIGWVTGISRVESLSAAANIFVGQSESPLVIRPYLAALTPAQLFTVMTVGMAGVAGTILAAYAALLGAQYLPYLLAAAFMSAPGGVLMAKMIMPDEPPKDELPLDGGVADDQVDVPETLRKACGRPMSSWPRRRGPRPASSWRSRWVRWCWRSLLFVALANGLLADRWLVWSAQSQFSDAGRLHLCANHVLIRVPWTEAGVAGGLFGTKMSQRIRRVHRLGNAAGPAAALSDRSRAIVTCLVRFANFS